MISFTRSILFLGLLLVGNQGCVAHGPAPRVAELFAAKTRLFIADASNGDVVVVDLLEDQHRIVDRISTPPFIMILALTEDQHYLFAMRGRHTDRDYVTLLDSGYDAATGDLRLPFVARTWIGNAPGGGHLGHMSRIGNQTAMVNEGLGELIVFQQPLDSMDGFSALPVRTYTLANPDHCDYQDANGRIYVGYLMGGFIQILDQESGEELDRISDCPIFHGDAKDEDTGRLLFACDNYTLVIGTQGDGMSQVLDRLPYPEEQRAGAFLKGKDGVLWAYTEGTLPLLYRLDLKTQPYRFETLDIGGSSLRQATSEPDGAFLLTLSPAGVLGIRDGHKGALLHSVQVVGEDWEPEFDEDVVKASLPDIAAMGGLAYVSIPDKGFVAEVDLHKGILLRKIETGGEPTRVVLMDTGASNGTWPEADLIEMNHTGEQDGDHGDGDQEDEDKKADLMPAAEVEASRQGGDGGDSSGASLVTAGTMTAGIFLAGPLLW